jgi:hypothetical protein
MLPTELYFYLFTNFDLFYCVPCESNLILTCLIFKHKSLYYGWGTLCTKEHFTLRNILLLKSWTHLAAQHTWQSHNLLLSTPCSLTPFATQNPLLLITPCSLTPFATQNPLLLITPCSSTLFASQHPLLPGALYYSTHFTLWTEKEIIPFIHFYLLV